MHARGRGRRGETKSSKTRGNPPSSDTSHTPARGDNVCFVAAYGVATRRRLRWQLAAARGQITLGQGRADTRLRSASLCETREETWV